MRYFSKEKEKGEGKNLSFHELVANENKLEEDIPLLFSI